VKEHGENMQQFYAVAQRMCERALIAWWQFNGEKWDGAITRRGGQRARRFKSCVRATLFRILLD